MLMMAVNVYHRLVSMENKMIITTFVNNQAKATVVPDSEEQTKDNHQRITNTMEMFRMRKSVADKMDNVMDELFVMHGITSEA